MTRPGSYLYNPPSTSLPYYQNDDEMPQNAYPVAPSTVQGANTYGFDGTPNYGQGYMPTVSATYGQAYNAPVAGTVIAGQDRSVLNGQPFGAGLTMPAYQGGFGGNTTANALSPLAEYPEPQEVALPKPTVADFEIESIAVGKNHKWRKIGYWTAGLVLVAGAVAGGVVGSQLGKKSGASSGDNGAGTTLPASGTTGVSTTLTSPVGGTTTAPSAVTTTPASTRSTGTTSTPSTTTSPSTTRPTTTQPTTTRPTTTRPTTTRPTTTQPTTTTEPTTTEPTTTEPTTTTDPTEPVTTVPPTTLDGGGTSFEQFPLSSSLGRRAVVSRP